MAFDYYGETAKLKIKGSDKFPSCLGTLISFVVFGTVLAYSINKYAVLAEYGDTLF